MFGIKQKSSIADLKPVWSIQLEDYIISLDCSNDGERIVAATSEGPIFIILAKHGEVLHQLPGHAMGNLSVSCSYDGRFLASSGQDGSAKIWCAESGTCIGTIKSNAAWIEHVDWSPVSNYLAVSAGKSLGIYKTDGTLQTSFLSHKNTISGVQWKRDGTQLASVAYNKLYLWNTDNTKPATEFHWQDAMIALCWSPDAKYIACGCQGASVHVWNVFSGEDLQMWGYPVKVKALSWDSMSTQLATGGSNEICIWNFEGAGPSGQEPTNLRSHLGLITQLHFQTHGELLASAADDFMLLLWHPKKKRPQAMFVGPLVSSMVWGSNDTRLFSGFEDGSITCFNTQPFL